MQMRKFVITLHEDGSVQWNEYEEPGEKLRQLVEEANKSSVEQAIRFHMSCDHKEGFLDGARNATNYLRFRVH